MKKIMGVSRIVLCLGIMLLISSISSRAVASTPVITPGVSIQAYGVSYYHNSAALYTIVMKIEGSHAAKYIIERQAVGSDSRVKIMERTLAEMEQNKFEYTDYGALEKHQQYQYFLKTFDQAGNFLEEVSVTGRVANLQYKEELKNSWPVISQNNATFTLGSKVDPENEALEYRLYTRIPGGGGEKLLKSWQPVMNKQQVTVNFSRTCQWRLVCIEVDSAIVDRSESVLVDWSMFVKQ